MPNMIFQSIEPNNITSVKTIIVMPNMKKNINYILRQEILLQTLFGNPKGPVKVGNPNTCTETKLCLNFILFQFKK